MKIKVLLIPVLLVLAQNRAIACSCVAPLSLSGVDEYSTIFVGKLIANETEASLTQNRYTFSINQELSGDPATTLNLWSEKSSAACGYHYKVNTEYLIIAYPQSGKYYSGQCSSWPVASDTAQKLLREIQKAQ